MMVQLLHKLKITSNDGGEPLLKVVKNPVVDHLPPGATKLAITGGVEDVVNLKQCVKNIENPRGYAVALTCNPNGICSVPWSDISINISQYLCSTTTLVGRVVSSFEEKFAIL
uniref:Ribosomal RNA small subunit methyltransferase NEP1 n=1 Tax=Lygus hesperus TaxID=30085 RepID=A0A0A9XL03_LYGHE